MLLFLRLLLLLPFALPLLLLYQRRRRRRLLAQLRGKHVWVVGASRGIGRATAELAAAHGATVSISSRPSSALTALATSLGPALHVCHPLDVTADWPTLRAAYTAVADTRPVDILVLNAGINHGGRAFLQLTDSEVDAVLNTNAVAVARLLRISLPYMVRHAREAGTRPVAAVVSSLAAYRGVPGASVYGASKAAVSTLCESLGVELYALPVHVVGVHPGFVATEAIAGLNHVKPFLMSEDEAGQHVLIGALTRRPHYAFPVGMEWVVMPAARLLPRPVYDYVMHKVHRKEEERLAGAGPK